MATKEQVAKTKASKPKSLKSAPASQQEKLKTVIRRLPPNLPEEVFWQSVQQWVTEDTVSWKVFYPGKVRNKYVQ